MNEYTCSIIADLLPSYIEGLTLADTNRFIADHLEQCADCRQLFEEYTADLSIPVETPTKYDRKIVRSMRFQLLWYLIWPLIYGVLMQFRKEGTVTFFIVALSAAWFVLFTSHVTEYNFDLDDTKKTYYDTQKRMVREGKGTFFKQGLFWILPILLPTIFLAVPWMIQTMLQGGF